jgi:hypothetical protein
MSHFTCSVRPRQLSTFQDAQKLSTPGMKHLLPLCNQKIGSKQTFGAQMQPQ